MSTTKYIVNNVTGQTINGESVLRPYKVYTALLSQINTDPPTENVLEDTLGHTGFTWSYSSTGTYFAESVGLFESSGITFLVSGIGNNNTGIANIYKYDANRFTIETFNTTFTPSDNILSNSMVEIRVYN